MATTANSTTPMVHLGGVGGTRAAAAEPFLAADGAIALGDLLIVASGEADEDNADPVGAAIIGVALNDTVAAGDTINVAMAYDGQLFGANFIGAAVTDRTPLITDLLTKAGIDPSTDGFASLTTGGTNTPCRTVHFDKQTGLTQQHLGPLILPTETAIPGAILNARMTFVFTESLWSQPGA